MLAFAPTIEYVRESPRETVQNLITIGAVKGRITPRIATASPIEFTAPSPVHNKVALGAVSGKVTPRMAFAPQIEFVAKSPRIVNRVAMNAVAGNVTPRMAIGKTIEHRFSTPKKVVAATAVAATAAAVTLPQLSPSINTAQLKQYKLEV